MKNKKRIWTIVVIVLAVFALTTVALNYWAKRRLQQEIENLAAKSSNDLYTLRVGGSYLNLWNGELSVRDVSLTTDTAAWLTVRECQPDSFPSLIFLSIDAIHIRNFSWFGYFSNKNLRFRKLVFDHPVFRMTQCRDTSAEEVSLKKQLLRLPERLSPVAEALLIKHISINHADIELQTISTGDTTRQRISDAEIYVRNLNINKKSSEITFSEDIVASTKHVEFLYNKSTQMIVFDDFIISKNGGQISVRNFSVIPQISEQEFNRQHSVRRPYFNFSSPAITIHGFDMNRMLQHNYFSAESLKVEQPDIHLAISRFLPLPYQKSVPQEMVRKIKNQFHIKEITVLDARIVLTTRVPGLDYDISFNHSYISAENFSNDTAFMSDVHPLEIWAESRFMEVAPVKMKLNIPLLSHTFEADYTATIHDLSLDVLNPLFQHQHVAIKSGYLKSASIRSIIRNGIANGYIKIQYDDLKVLVMRKDTHKVRKVASKLANLFVNDENLIDDDPSTKFIIGEINYTRTRQEELFGFMWHSIQTGLLPTLVPAYEKLKRN